MRVKWGQDEYNAECRCDVTSLFPPVRLCEARAGRARGGEVHAAIGLRFGARRRRPIAEIASCTVQPRPERSSRYGRALVGR